MTFGTDVVIGIDIGTTSSKAIARSTARHVTRLVEQTTPWHTHDGGYTEIAPPDLLALAAGLIGRAVRAAESEWGPVRVRSVGVAGLAESGVLFDAARRPAAPVIAWFGHRGENELGQLAEEAPGSSVERGNWVRGASRVTREWLSRR